MNKYIKEFGKVLLASGALIFIIMCPVAISLGLYYFSEYLTNIGLVSGYPEDISSYISGSIISSSVMFFFLIWLIETKKLKMEK